jgi:HAMP domain-containing protein
LLLVASSELPMAFYTGTLTASLGILIFSVLLWLVIARQIKRLITRPIHELEELSRQVTREETTPCAPRGNHDEIGSLAEAFNTMLSRIEAREQQLKRAGRFPGRYDQAQGWRKKPATPTASWSWKSRCAARSRKTHRLSELSQQHHRLHAVGTDRPRRAALRHAVEPGSQRPLRHAPGRSLEPADLPRLRTAQAVSAAAQATVEQHTVAKIERVPGSRTMNPSIRPDLLP